MFEETSNSGQSRNMEADQSHIQGEFPIVPQIDHPNAQNYFLSSQQVRVVLKGQGLFTHLLNSEPKPGDPEFKT